MHTFVQRESLDRQTTRPELFSWKSNQLQEQKSQTLKVYYLSFIAQLQLKTEMTNARSINFAMPLAYYDFVVFPLSFALPYLVIEIFHRPKSQPMAFNRNDHSKLCFFARPLFWLVSLAYSLP